MAANDLYGWFPTMSQPLTAAPVPNIWNIPERSSGALPANQDLSAIPLNFGMGPLSQLAFQMAGSPKRPPLPDKRLPFSDPSSGVASDTGPGVLGILQDAKRGNDLYNKVSGNTGDPAIQQPNQLNELGSKVGLTSGLSPGWASGANANNAALSQLNYPSAIGFDSGGLATGYAPAATLAGSLSGIGSGAAANAALSEAGFLGGWTTPTVEASLAGASGAGAGAGAAAGSAGASGASGAGAGVLASSGALQAIPLAAAGFALASYLNTGPLNDDKSKDRNEAAYMAYTGAKPVSLPLGRTAEHYYALPDGRLISAQDFDNLAGSWYGATYAPDGNPADWQAKYDSFLQNLQPATLPKGYTWDGTRFVRT